MHINNSDSLESYERVRRHRRRTSTGFTTIELLIVLAIFGILASIVALNLRPLSNHAQNGASALAAGFKQARAAAMSTTSAYRMVYVSDKELNAEYAITCDSSHWTADSKFDVSVEDSARFAVKGKPDAGPGDVVACYSSRGLAESSSILVVEDDRGRTAQVEIFVGGAVEVE